MWCSDWTEILCGNISWLEEHPLQIPSDLHERFGRCFRTAGASWARARSWDIWRDIALSEGTSLRQWEICSCVFSKIFYGGIWGAMRSRHNISGQSEVVWQVNPRFEKTTKVWRLLADFHIGIFVDVVPCLG